MDNKLTDIDIKKILECCSKGDCENCNRKWSYNNQWDCMRHIQRLSFDLINRLQAEKSNFEIELKAMRGSANSYKAENNRFKNILHLQTLTN